MQLSECENLKLETRDRVLYVTLNRPQAKNAMSAGMVGDLIAVFEVLRDDLSIRAVVLRGAEGNFCAGADIKDMARGRKAKPSDGDGDPLATMNRQFGSVITAVNNTPQAVIAVIEGAVLGGGFGLACVSDIAIAHAGAKFGLPETGLGIPPAQIAPFVVQRIGLTQARRLGMCGARFDGAEAQRLGIVHFVCGDEGAIEARLEETLNQIRRCAPRANAVTKRLMLQVMPANLEHVLNEAAVSFAEAVRGPEGAEGTTAFIEKRKPSWAEE